MPQQTNPEIMLRNVRLSFANTLFQGESGETRKSGKHAGKTPYRWSANFLIPKDREADIAAIKDAMRQARDQQWPTDPPKIKAEKLAMRDGDEETYAGYAGNMYVSASRTAYGKDGVAPKRPHRIIGRNKVKGEDGQRRFPNLDDDGTIYAGCYVNALIRFWAQDDPEYGKRINASIEAVQFWDDGEAFGGGGSRANLDDEFDEFGGDEFEAATAASDDDGL